MEFDCAIHPLIQDPLALKLLEGVVRVGDSVTVDADLKKVEMKFEREAAKGVRGLGAAVLPDLDRVRAELARKYPNAPDSMDPIRQDRDSR